MLPLGFYVSGGYEDLTYGRISKGTFSFGYKLYMNISIILDFYGNVKFSMQISVESI